MKNIFIYFVIVALCLVFVGCSGGSSSDNTATEEINVVANANTEPEVDSNTNVNSQSLKGEEAKVVLAHMRSVTDVKIKMGPSTKFNVYDVTYVNRPTKREEAQISIVTMESDLIGVEIKYLYKNKMTRLLQKSAKVIAYDDGKEWVVGNNAKAQKCLNTARKTVGKYESTLKVPESQLEDFLWFDCMNLPKGWLIPLSKDFDEGRYDSGN